jgi:predicted SprT family Zn-dependent metalloprotease
VRRHNSALRGRRYFCRHCRQRLRFSHREAPAEEQASRRPD